MNIMRSNRILMRTVAVLLMLVLISTGIVTGRYARYTTTVSGSDSARVARFSVTAKSRLLQTTLPLEMIPGTTTEQTILVDNDSEVAIRYTITADNPYRNFPVVFQIRDGETTHDVPFSADMAPDTWAEYTLVVTWNGSKDISYSGRVDLIELTLNATQID